MILSLYRTTLLVISIFSLLLFFNVFQIYKFKSSTEIELTHKNPSYRALNNVNIDLVLLKDTVTQGGLAKTQEEVDKSKKIYHDFKNSILESLAKIDDSYFQEIASKNNIIHNKKVNKENLKESLKKMFEEAEISLKNSETLLNRSSDLKEARKELSKVYRASFTLAKFSEGWGRLSRAVITVLSSDSNKDVAYSGRAIFNDAKEYYSKIKLAENEKNHWEQIEKNFASTLAVALEVTGVSEDNQLSIFRESAENIILNIGSLKIVGETDSSNSQKKLVEQAKISFFSVLIATIILIALSLSFIISYFNRVKKQIFSALENITLVAKGVKNNSQDLLVLGKNLSTKAVDLSSGVDRTSSAIHEISVMLKHTENTTKQSLQQTSDLSQNANQGELTVKDMKQSVKDLNQSINEVLKQISENNQDMKRFSQYMKDIRSKTSAINEIVFQTKLLSFNASVEAARAGKNGNGFAVVADEMGGLARLSGNAAQEINSIITSSESSIIDLIKMTESNISNISKKTVSDTKETTDMVNKSLTEFIKISELVKKVQDNANVIATATSEQSKAIIDVNLVVDRFTELNNELTKSAGTTSKVAEDLDSDASELTATIRKLALDLLGERMAAPMKDDIDNIASDLHEASPVKPHSAAKHIL